MKHLALGWACNLNDIFVRFPYEKYKSLMSKFKTKLLRRQKIKQVFREGIQQILQDIVENNVTFKIQGVGYQGGEIHMEAVTGSDFERGKSRGKFKVLIFLNHFLQDIRCIYMFMEKSTTFYIEENIQYM